MTSMPRAPTVAIAMYCSSRVSSTMASPQARPRPSRRPGGGDVRDEQERRRLAQPAVPDERPVEADGTLEPWVRAANAIPIMATGSRGVRERAGGLPRLGPVAAGEQVPSAVAHPDADRDDDEGDGERHRVAEGRTGMARTPRPCGWEIRGGSTAGGSEAFVDRALGMLEILAQSRGADGGRQTMARCRACVDPIEDAAASHGRVAARDLGVHRPRRPVRPRRARLEHGGDHQIAGIAGREEAARQRSRRVRSSSREVDRTFSPFRPLSEVTLYRDGLDRSGPPQRRIRGGPALLRCSCGRLTRGAFDPWAVPGGYDPSGYVKGWAAGRASALLRDAGFADHLVNAGGDICAAGDELPGSVGLARRHPESACARRGRRGRLAVERCDGHVGSLRAWRPRHRSLTGRPALAVDSATVVGPDAGIADARPRQRW